MSPEQSALQDKLVERYERIRYEKIDPREDNALKITTDGRKLAIDAKMLSADAEDFPESKINRLVENVAAIWDQTKEKRGTQLIFADMGVNPTPWGYSPYDDIVKKLIAHGVPAERIATIGEAESDAKKQALFEKVRQGSVRVLIGSTQKMGTGTNVQKRLVALHHLDAPWKPAEIEQREGRILRQGNENAEVAIYRYVTEGSFDAFMWQALETKARFIAQVITGNNCLRRADDIGGQELSYAEVKAIASGNPAVLTLAEADAELQRLALLKRNHMDEQYVARRNVQDLPKTIAGLSERIAKLKADRDTIQQHADDAVVIAGHKCLREDVMPALTGQLDSLPLFVREPTRFELGTYHGLKFGFVLHSQVPPDVFVEGALTRQTSLREHQGPRAVFNAVERLVEGYGPEAKRVGEDLGLAQSQLRDYQSRLGATFGHESYLAELTELRDLLKAGLSGRVPDEGTGGLTVAELAGQIKALKALQTIELAPQRAGQRSITAAEPVTARIRRRAEAAVVSDAETPTGPEVPEADSDPSAKSTWLSMAKKFASFGLESSYTSNLHREMTHQQRLAKQRQSDDPEPNLR